MVGASQIAGIILILCVFDFFFKSYLQAEYEHQCVFVAMALVYHLWVTAILCVLCKYAVGIWWYVL